MTAPANRPVRIARATITEVETQKVLVFDPVRRQRQLAALMKLLDSGDVPREGSKP